VQLLMSTLNLLNTGRICYYDRLLPTCYETKADACLPVVFSGLDSGFTLGWPEAALQDQR
jgi:hypothetical protein